MDNDEQLEIYDKIMNGGYGTIHTPKIMIVGDLELLKEVILNGILIQKQEVDRPPED